MDGPIQRGSRKAASDNSLTSALHEINNPLESLLNLLYQLESDWGISEQSRVNVKMAQAEVMRVSRIAQAAMKRSPRGETQEKVDVAMLLASVLELHKSKLARHKVVTSCRFDENAMAIVHPEQMRQVFSNLLLNAIDAMPEGGKIIAKVSKTREWCDPARAGLRIAVADTGGGIPADILSVVREPFFTTKGAHGNGMGLAVVQDIVTYHQGRLQIRSSTKSGSSGSVFSIFIPAAGLS